MKIRYLQIDKNKEFRTKNAIFSTNKAQTNATNSVYFWHKLGMKKA
jgi:hypothetical protein